MSEAKRNNRTLKEIVSDATDRDLERYETGILTPDRLKKLASDADKRKKRRHRRIAGIAALFVAVVAGAIMVFDFADTDVEADKNSKEEIVTEDGVIIEDGGWGSEGEENWEITDWDEVEIAKATIPELIVPEYIPEGYNFKNLFINEDEKVINIEYVFLNDINNKKFIIYQYIHIENLEATFINDNSKILKTNKGYVYIVEGPQNNKATIQIDDGNIIDIWGQFSDHEIKMIINNIRL